MNPILFYTIFVLTGIGILAAVIIYIVAQKFKVEEDPRIQEIEQLLPGANCGGCGFPNCHCFAEEVVKNGDLSKLYCPVSGNEGMKNIAEVLGVTIEKREPKIAVLLCNGTCEYREKTNIYDGVSSCAIAANLYGGDTDCQYGCLGLGDCVRACPFDAMYMDEKTGLPVIIEDKCTGCNACVIACPKNILELRKKGPKGRRVYVACSNKDKGAIAKKSCAVACIGCSKCVKVCDKFYAIEVKDFLAYIDDEKCHLCRKCVEVCPTNAILAVNFPPLKKKETTTKAAVNTSTAQQNPI